MKKNIQKLANGICTCAIVLLSITGWAQETTGGAAGTPYPNMPVIAPIGVRIGKHIQIDESGKGPEIDPSKGYRVEELGKNLYMLTDNAIQCMFMVYEKGVVLLDAPEQLAQYIPKAIAAITDKPITHFIYSHHHADHVGAAGDLKLARNVVIIGHEETKKLLLRAEDPNRPVPTFTFKDKYTLKVGSQVLELSYHGNAHEPGNIFIYAPNQRTLMVIDIIFPGWIPWRRFAIAQDIPGYFRQMDEINKLDWDLLVTGHVKRIGTHADVALQLEFMNDLRNTTREALKSTKFLDGINPADNGNPWAVFDDYIDRVVIRCVNTLTPKWSARLAGFDVFIWDQCYSMEQSLRLDEH